MYHGLIFYIELDKKYFYDSEINANDTKFLLFSEKEKDAYSKIFLGKKNKFYITGIPRSQDDWIKKITGIALLIH